MACGQSTFATMQGKVSDASAGVVPGARASVRNVGQNVTTAATTNELGNYEVQNLSPGQYELTVEAQGFKKFLHGGIELNARQVVRIDARLEVGGAHEQVTVTEGSPVVASETATIDDARTNREILSLPINFRAATTSLAQVIALAPGVQVRGGAENFSIAGSRLSQNETSIDGI